MNLGFIIPSYKNEKQLKKCEEAIDALDTKHSASTFIYDNNENNLGFTKAVNIGLSTFTDGMTDYCIVLNQDCYIKPDFADKAAKFMQDHPKCFIAGVKQLSDEDEDFIVHAGCTEAFPQGKHIVGKKSMKHSSKSKQMPWVNGACMIVNMSLLPSVGNMDEGFWLIGSDSDWCYTARMKGFEVWYCADIEVIHEGGISMERGSDKMETQKVLDMTYFNDKWIGNGLFRELSQEVFR